MKVLRDGKEVKNAEIIYTTNGTVDTVRVDGVHYDASVFELKDEKAEVKTKGSKEATKPAQKVAKKLK